MENQTKFKRIIIQNGGSKGLNIPPELLEHIDATLTTEVTLTAHTGKKGKFIAVYKEEPK